MVSVQWSPNNYYCVHTQQKNNTIIKTLHLQLDSKKMQTNEIINYK